MVGFEEASDDGLGGVVGQVGDELVGRIRWNRGRDVDFAGVGVDDADVGMLGEFGGECGGEVVVEFDGGEAGGAFGEGAGEDAAAGADFEDGVGGGEVCG